jgi:hypothetical protein
LSVAHTAIAALITFSHTEHLRNHLRGSLRINPNEGATVAAATPQRVVRNSIENPRDFRQ